VTPGILIEFANFQKHLLPPFLRYRSKPEDGGSGFFRNVSKFQSEYITPHAEKNGTLVSACMLFLLVSRIKY